MTRKLRARITQIIAAAAIATASFSAPAIAGGSISFTIAPKNQDEAQAMRAGLAIYSLIKAVKGNGAINQHGFNNVAGIAQNGGGNFGVVHQEGDDHNGTLQQNGNHNSYGLFQFGKGTNGRVAQNGHGNIGATFQFGW